MLDFFVPEEYEGVRLKGFLRGCCGVSARLLARLKREPEGICVNGLTVNVLEILHTGDHVRLSPPPDEKLPVPEELPFAVAYEDDHILIADKPSGMPMYPTPGHDRDSLANAAGAYFAGRRETLAFRPVYRLDRDTSGLVVLAKNQYAAGRLSGNIKKRYYALCEGEMKGAGTIDAPIAVLAGHRVQRGVQEGGVRSVTHWEALDAGGGHTLLRIRLETGRTHQIRVHLAWLGHPLAGDDMYGGAQRWITRQALHCGEICLVHPLSGEQMQFTSPFPSDMELLCKEWELCGTGELSSRREWMQRG